MLSRISRWLPCNSLVWGRITCQDCRDFRVRRLDMEYHTDSPLDRLDRLLAEVPPLPSYAEALNDPEYTLQYDQFHQVTSQRKNGIDYIVKKAHHFLRTRPGPLFRICSIGCGNGRFDQEVLTRVSEQFPDTKLQYVGMDVSEFSCQRARDLLAPLSSVEAEVHTRDIQQLDTADVQPFDLVIAVHVLYYVTSLEAVLSNILKMIKPNGLAIILHCDKTPLRELLHRFWIHEYKRQFWFTPHVFQALDNLGVSYTRDSVHELFDFTTCFMDGFQQPNHKQILDFVTQTKLSRYPPAIAKTCIKYISSIAIGKPDKFLVPDETERIVIEDQS